ncbi:MAG: hypothetical protein NC916_02385, partial [Candidatus Omnitrophica bacterium]|nr:hypothetical protein [Candidatus Omnitrophota bacterium]
MELEGMEYEEKNNENIINQKNTLLSKILYFAHKCQEQVSSSSDLTYSIPAHRLSNIQFDPSQNKFTLGHERVFRSVRNQKQIKHIARTIWLL